ncbi:MAG TPA: acyl-CoA dehydrogenase family protein [Sporichthyaceae bacterium]|jgi:alkylation response protein AidB-like acyl-CoA dehydrogenase
MSEPESAMFVFSDEQDALRATVRRFLAERSPETEVRRLMETDAGYDPTVWQLMAGQLGLAGLALPEKFGGSGFGFVDLQIVFEEMGRALLCAPFLSSVVLAANAVLRSGDEAACAQYLPGIADGTTIAALAVTEASGSWGAADVSTEARAVHGGYALTGEKLFILDGHVADVLFVVARTDAGPSLFAVDPAAGGVDRTAMGTLDATRKQSRVVFDGTPARLIGEDGGAAQPLADTLDLAAAALAAEQAGGARRVLEMAVEYAKVREQFGRPIGSFQAIKHKCADMLLAVESATSAAYAVGWAIDEGSDEVGVLASLAKAFCSEAYTHCTAENIQIHGGIGFTWEHPAHLYFKRAKSTEILFGNPRYHRALLADRLGI